MSSHLFRAGIVPESAIQTCGYGIAVHVLRGFGAVFEAKTSLDAMLLEPLGVEASQENEMCVTREKVA
jgi:hypothetical protein